MNNNQEELELYYSKFWKLKLWLKKNVYFAFAGVMLVIFITKLIFWD